MAEHSEDFAKVSIIATTVYSAKFIMCAIGLVVTLAAAQFIGILSLNMPFVIVSFASVALKALLPDYELQGLENMKPLTLRFVVTQMLALVGIIVFVKGPEQLLLVPILEGLASLVSLVWTEVYLRNRYGLRFSKTSFGNVLAIFRNSMPFFLAAAAGSLMASTITFLMGVFPTDMLIISCWSITNTIISGIEALWQPISRSLFPHMVKRRDIYLVKKLLKIGMPIDIVGVIICMAAAGPIIRIIGGADYVPGAYVLTLVAPELIFSYPVSIFGYPVIGALGSAEDLSRCILIAALFQLLILIPAGLIGQFGMVAITIARVGSEAVLCLLEGNIARDLLVGEK